MASRDFHLGDILSVTTDRLLSPRLIDGVYDILSYMTGESVYTHQLQRIAREAKPVLLRRHPQLADIDTSGITRENYKEKLAGYTAQFGEMLPVSPMSEDEHESRDPMSELAEIVHPDWIIVVETKK